MTAVYQMCERRFEGAEASCLASWGRALQRPWCGKCAVHSQGSVRSVGALSEQDRRAEKRTWRQNGREGQINSWAFYR